MATNMATDDYFKVSVCCQAVDQISLNVFSFSAFNVVDTYTYDDLAGSMGAALLPLYQAILPAEASFYGLAITRQRPLPITQPAYYINLQPGSASGTLTSRQVTGLITKQTGIGGRAGRGRTYVPFLATSMVSTTGHLSTAGNTALNALAVQLFTQQVYGPNLGGGLARINPVLAQRPFPAFTLVNNYQVRTKLATQRRRGDFGRPNALPF